MRTFYGANASVRKDTCVRFSGSGYVEFGSIGALNFERTDPFSLYCWIRYSQTGVGNLCSRHGNTSSRTGWAMLVNAGQILMVLKNNNSPNQLRMDTVSTFNDSKWHSVIMTYDGSVTPGGFHIYVDNVDQSLTNVTNTLTGSIQGSFNTEFGRDVIQAAFQYTGDCGGWAAFSGVVPSTTRDVLHNGRRPPELSKVIALPNILNYWQMGDGDVFPTIRDRVSTSNGVLTSLDQSALKAYGPPYS